MVKKFFLLFSFLFFFFSISNVYAADYTPYGLKIPSSSSFSYGIERLPYRLYGNSGVTTRLSVSVFSSQGVDINQQPYIIFEVCAPSTMGFSISNSATEDAWISDKNVKYLLTNKKCSLYSSNDSDILLVYTQVGKWSIPSGGADVYFVDSYLNFNAQNVAWNWTADITNIYITNENTYQQDYSNYQNLIQSNTIINQNQTIINQNQSTNDKLNETNDKLNETNDKLDNLDGTLNNSNIDNPNFEEFEQYISDNGVITQLITLPVRLYTQILNNINSSCTPFVLGELFGHNLSMACIEPSNFFGSALWNTIDILGSGLFIYAISKKMIAVFHQFTNLEEGDILD